MKITLLHAAAYPFALVRMTVQRRLLRSASPSIVLAYGDGEVKVKIS